MARLIQLSALFFVLVLFYACSNTQSTSDNHNAPDTSEDGPTPYEITIGSGGGVTGNVTGINIDLDGKVTEWSALANQDAKPEYLGEMPQTSLNTLYTIIDEDELMNFDYAETGNMTAFLTLKGGGDIHRMRWSGIETDTTTAPVPLRRFITALNKSYKTIEKP